MIVRIGAGSKARTRRHQLLGIKEKLTFLSVALLAFSVSGYSHSATADPFPPPASGFAGAQTLPELGARAESFRIDEEKFGRGLYRILDKPHRLVEAVGGYGLRMALEESGISYEYYRKLVKRVTTVRLTNDSTFYVEPNSVNLESRYLEGELVTRFSTKPNGDVQLSVQIPF